MGQLVWRIKTWDMLEGNWNGFGIERFWKSNSISTCWHRNFRYMAKQFRCVGNKSFDVCVESFDMCQTISICKTYRSLSWIAILTWDQMDRSYRTSFALGQWRCRTQFRHGFQDWIATLRFRFVDCDFDVWLSISLCEFFSFAIVKLIGEQRIFFFILKLSSFIKMSIFTHFRNVDKICVEWEF